MGYRPGVAGINFLKDVPGGDQRSVLVGSVVRGG